MWNNMEDVQESLFEYSHLDYPSSSNLVAPPISISEYRARTALIRKPGLFDEQPESKEIFISGRGKHHPGTIICPGKPVISTPEEDMDIRRKIREVSGLGYSNELIERMYGHEESLSLEDEDDTEHLLPNLKLKSVESITEKDDLPVTDLEEKNSSPSWNAIVEKEKIKKKGYKSGKSRGIGKSQQKM